jgi:hypothetical protein
MIRRRLLAYPRRAYLRSVLLAGPAIVTAAALAVPTAASAQTASPARPATTPRQATAIAAGSTAAGSTAAGSTVAGSTAAGGRPSLALPGLHARSYTVTLITGDQVKFTAEGNGKYSVDPAPAARPGSATAIQVTDTGGRDGSIYAVPSDATPLIIAGQLSMQLFDVSYLISHGDTGPAGHLPVSVQYAGRHGRVNLSVSAGRARAFWSALTGGTATAGAGRVRLAGGAEKVTLDGTAAAAAVRAGAPDYTLTEDVTARDSAGACGSDDTTLCPEFPSFLTDISTDGYQGEIAPTSMTCVNSDPCRTLQLQWSVPAGIYMAANTFLMSSASRSYSMFAQEPQIDVKGDTSVAIDLNDAQPVTISTPHPSEAYADGVFAVYRGYPGLSADQGFADFTASVYGYDDYWAVPTQPVTIGTFKTALQFFLGKPYLAMSVKAPEPITLNPLYSQDISVPGAVVRFSGRRTMPLAYAGVGAKKDYAGLNAHGKLVLIRMLPWACGVSVGQLNNARNAGAAGVLLDPIQPNAVVGSCGIPLTTVSQSGPLAKVPDIPFAALPLDQATMLIGLLSQGPVTITAADGGTTPYLYELYLQQENAIPSSLTYDLTNQQVALVNANYHQTRPEVDTDSWEAAGPDEGYAVNIPYEFSGPASIQEYFGPVSPDTVDISQTIFGPLTSGTFVPTSAAVFTRPSTSTQDWGEAPAGAVGTIGISPKVNQAVPGSLFTFCAACRQGDMFYPEMYQTFPEAGLGDVTGYIPSTVTLYQNGQLVPQGSVEGFPDYQLPAQQADYQLTLDQGKAGTTTWNFSSAQPSKGQAPEGTGCIGTELGSTDPCQPVPLIFLRYNAGLDLDNQWPAPGSYPLRITAYHQEPGAPAITGLTLWTSTNGGASWKKATVTGQGNGAYATMITVPELSATSGTVSIKVQAQDAGGNDVTQIMYNAWTLAAASS